MWSSVVWSSVVWSGVVWSSVVWSNVVWVAKRVVMAARDLCWGGFRSEKHCVFSCKMAGSADEGQLLCEVGAGWLRPRVGVVRLVMAVSMCVTCFCTLQFYAFVELVVADGVGMAG